MSDKQKGESRDHLNKTTVVGRRATKRVPRKPPVDKDDALMGDVRGLLALSRQALQEIETDPAVALRPGLRYIRRSLWLPHCHLNGDPFKDPKTGETIKLSRQELAIVALVSGAINPQNPRQYDFLDLLLRYMGGPPPTNPLAITGAGGGPLKVQDVPADPAVLASRVAETLNVLRDLAGEGRQRLEPIEVQEAKVVEKPAMTAEFVATPAPPGQQPQTQRPDLTAPLRVVGMIPTR